MVQAEPTPAAPAPMKVSKTVSMRVDMIAAITRRADAEGHGKFSEVVVKAVERYLRTPIEEAPHDDAA